MSAPMGTVVASDGFTAPLREAWAAAYAGISAFMLAGARGGQQTA